MTSPAYEPGASEDGLDEGHTPCRECDPDLLDELKCRAKGIEAEAAYNALTMDELTQARTQYDSARTEYNKARKAAIPDIRELGEQLYQVVDQLKCLVDNQEIQLLDRAYAIVEERLDDYCGDKRGCYFHEGCDFGDEVDDFRPEDIAERIASIERSTKAAKGAFDDLIAEPTNLPKRVAAIKAELEGIVTNMAADSRTVDFKQLYVAARVARLHLACVHRGFVDTNAYIDCLCHALTCQLKGHTAISRLKGREAVHKCHLHARQARCKRLRARTVDEVMAEYIRIRSADPREHEGVGRDRDDDEKDENRAATASGTTTTIGAGPAEISQSRITVTIR